MADLPDLTNEEWEKLFKALTLHAAHRARRLYWRGLVGGENEPEALAAKAVELVVSGTRQCRAEDGRALLDTLRSVVNSLVSHLVESAEHARSAEMVRIDDGARLDRGHPVAPVQEGPFERAADADGTAAFRARVTRLLDGESELEELFECLDAGITKPKEIALLMNVTVEDVNKLKKRLARRLESLRPEKGKAKRGRVGTA